VVRTSFSSNTACRSEVVPHQQGRPARTASARGRRWRADARSRRRAAADRPPRRGGAVSATSQKRLMILQAGHGGLRPAVFRFLVALLHLRDLVRDRPGGSGVCPPIIATPKRLLARRSSERLALRASPSFAVDSSRGGDVEEPTCRTSKQFGVYKLRHQPGQLPHARTWVEKLKVGQTRAQAAAQVLGTPAAHQRVPRTIGWDYVYEYTRSGKRGPSTVRSPCISSDDKLARWEGDELPARRRS